MRKTLAGPASIDLPCTRSGKGNSDENAAEVKPALWGAVGAIVFAGSVKDSATVMDPTGGLQSLALWARIQVPVGIKDEVVARERSVIALSDRHRGPLDGERFDDDLALERLLDGDLGADLGDSEEVAGADAERFDRSADQGDVEFVEGDRCAEQR